MKDSKENHAADPEKGFLTKSNLKAVWPHNGHSDSVKIQILAKMLILFIKIKCQYFFDNWYKIFRSTGKALGKVAEQLQHFKKREKFSSYVGKYFWYSWNKEKVQKYSACENKGASFFTFSSLHHGKLSQMKNICQNLNAQACL